MLINGRICTIIIYEVVLLNEVCRKCWKVVMIVAADFLTWTRLSVDGFTPPPSSKHCAVVVAQYQTSRRNYSMPTLHSRCSGGVDPQRASTGQRHRRLRQTEGSAPPGRPVLDSQESVETAMTELQTLGSDGDELEKEKSPAARCCDACTSTLRRSHRVTSRPTPFDDCDALFHSSREHLIVQPDSGQISTSNHVQNIEPSPPHNDAPADCPSCTDANCRCHHGSDNPTFVSDDVTLHHAADYVESVSENGGCRDHVSAAQALMQPVDSQGTDEPLDNQQMRSDAPMEMACYSLHQNGNRLVIEDLESGSCVVSSDTALMKLNGVGRPPLDVREAWPEKNSTNVSTDRNLNNVHDNQLPVCTIHCCVCVIHWIS